MSRLPLVLDLAEVVARARHVTPPQDLHGLRRPGVQERDAVLVHHGADLAEGRAADQGVADGERPLLHQDGRDRPSTLVQMRFDHRTPRTTGRVAFQLLQIGHEQDGLEQRVQVRLRLRGHVDELVRAAPFRRNDPAFDHLLANPCGIGIFLVHLVDRDDDRHGRRLRVVEGLDGLRHDPVVGRDHQDDDVGDLGAARSHGGERLVTRCVDERDLTIASVHLVGADVLGDAAELTRDHVGLADRVEELGLAVVDVTHHRDHRRPGSQLGLVDLFLGLVLQLLLDTDDLRLVAQVVGDQPDPLIGQRRGGRGHLSRHEQHLHDVGGGLPELLRDRLRRGAPDELHGGQQRASPGRAGCEG